MFICLAISNESFLKMKSPSCGPIPLCHSPSLFLGLEAGPEDERMSLACTLAGNFSGCSQGISDFVEKGFSLSNHRLP